MPSLARWLGAIAVAVAVFEGLDLVGSGPAVGGVTSLLASLPTISPFVTGAVAAWSAGPAAFPSLVAGVVAVWARIGVDRMIGMLQGAHPPAEAGIVLIWAFGVPWTIMALAGGVAVVLFRWGLRRRGRRRMRRARRSASPPGRL